MNIPSMGAIIPADDVAERLTARTHEVAVRDAADVTAREFGPRRVS